MPVAIALVTTHKDISKRKKRLTITGTLSGNYINGTPVVVDLTTVTNPKLLSNGKPSANPTHGAVINSPAGYTGKLVPGATIKTWGLTIYSAAGNELASAALPAALVAVPFEFDFEGPIGNF